MKNNNTNMQEEKIYQFFVSSTYEDLKMERQEVIAAIVNSGNVPIGMEYFPAGNASPFDYIKSQIDKADYYILVLAGKYGSINKETKISYTEMEFNYAVEKKVPIAVLLHKDIEKLNVDKTDIKDHEKYDLLKRFREVSKEGRMADFWESPIELRLKVGNAITNLIKTSPRVGWIRADSLYTSSELKQRDIRTITDLMSNFSTNLMDDYLENGPEFICDKLLNSYLYWHSIIEASSFYIDDQGLEHKLKEFYSNWKLLMCHGNWYSPSDLYPHKYKFFGLEHDAFISTVHERNFNYLVDLTNKTIPIYKDMIDYILRNYKLDLVILSENFQQK